MIPSGPGTTALDAAIGLHFPGVKPNVALAFADGEPPFAGAKIFEDPEKRFWFFATYGCSDLAEKKGGGPVSSGRGYELTMRVPFAPEPPLWVVPFLGELAHFLKPKGTSVSETEPVFLGRRLTTMEPTSLDAVYFAKDVQLGHGINTEFGYVTWLQVVGLYAAEAVQLTFTPGTRLPLEERLKPSNPHLLTILDRAPLPAKS